MFAMNVNCDVSPCFSDHVCRRVSVIMCPQPPSVAFTVVSVEGMQYGGRALYECETGYREVAGDRVKTCTGQGEWTGDHLQCQGQ